MNVLELLSPFSCQFLHFHSFDVQALFLKRNDYFPDFVLSCHIRFDQKQGRLYLISLCNSVRLFRIGNVP